MRSSERTSTARVTDVTIRYVLLAFLGLTTACSTDDAPLISDMQVDADPVQGSSRAHQQARNLGRGVNLGNALEAPNEGEWGVTLTEEDFERVAAAGFDHVRIPMRWSVHAAAEAPYELDPAFAERSDWAIDQALALGLRAILDIHHYEEIMVDPASHLDRLVGIWDQLAERYRDYPEELYFEILNEPQDALGIAPNNELIGKALEAIRRTNPTRTVIVDSTEWSKIRTLSELDLPAKDRNLIATFHFYEPMTFTHQGADWTDGGGEVGTDWPLSGEEASLRQQLSGAALWAKGAERPVYLGEFGAIDQAPIDARGRWTKAVVRRCDELNIPYGYWELRSSFGVYDSERQAWRQELVDAVLPGHSIPDELLVSGDLPPCEPAPPTPSSELTITSIAWTEDDYAGASAGPPVPDQVRDLQVSVTLAADVTALFVVAVDDQGRAAPLDGIVQQADTLDTGANPLVAICAGYTAAETWTLAVVEGETVLNADTGELGPLTVDGSRDLELFLTDSEHLAGQAPSLQVFALTPDGTLIASEIWPSDL